MEFVVDGYLRGWGLSGSNVDLDVGVALFPRRADVNRWNEHALQQIEQCYGATCERVDVHGFDPRLNAVQKDVDKRSFGGIQTPKVLKLRTCLQHRLRVIVLHNVNVAEGWANGARARLLAHDSWKGKAETLKRNLDRSLQQLRCTYRMRPNI